MAKKLCEQQALLEGEQDLKCKLHKMLMNRLHNLLFASPFR